jgi:predicted RND superfamily exporter protein
VAWLERRPWSILAVTLAILAGSIYLVAFHLPLRADFSYLLPQDAPSVRDLRKLEERLDAKDTALVLVVGPDATTRAAAAVDVAAGLRAIGPDLVDRVDTDDLATREFFRARRHLFVPLPDLVRARDALASRIEQAKLAANPLYVPLDAEEDAAAAAADKKQLEDLRARRRAAEAQLDRSGYVSKDGTTALIVVSTAFRGTDAKAGERLLAAIDRVRAGALARHPGVEIGVTGAISTAVAEHHALARGILWSSVITAGLVALLLVLYLRSATLLGLLTGNLVIATTVTFGVAALTVGHLNAATAFLGAIIAGNGVNYGILLIVRYLEERKDHAADPSTAMARALVATLRPTLVASLGAAIAYGSLAATSFRGFADFAVIGAVGMILCWIASYVVLPAVVLRFGRDTRIYRGDPFIGGILARVFGFRRPAVVCAVAGVLALAAGVVVVRYIAGDPFEYDIKKLRSEGDEAIASRHWMQVSDDRFGRGISGRTYVAADRPEQVPGIVTALREVDARTPDGHKTIGQVSSILDVIPPDQHERLAVLAELRVLLSDETALAELADAERAELAELRPPEGLAPIALADLPAEIRDRLTEKDGRVGYLIAIRPALTLDEWNGRDLIRFAGAVRELHLPDGETVTTSGKSVIFADIFAAIENDGGMVTAIALAGLFVMVVLVVGPNRRAAAVMGATILGALTMVAVCALVGIRVNFLDFIALPITLGLGIDYAINIAHRSHHEDDGDAVETMKTSGSAVLVCSLTTIIGYGSLLVSENLAIRGFGLASLIGEVTCVLAALAVVPAIIAVGRRSRTAAAPPEQSSDSGEVAAAV